VALLKLRNDGTTIWLRIVLMDGLAPRALPPERLQQKRLVRLGATSLGARWKPIVKSVRSAAQMLFLSSVVRPIRRFAADKSSPF
jgi:hypothetical protein